MPTAWDESVMIDGYPGDYVTYMRRSGEDYYIGAMTLEARTETVSLDFLPDGEFTAYIYYDDENRELALMEQTVTNADELTLDMPDIGGAAVEPLSSATAFQSNQTSPSFCASAQMPSSTQPSAV